MRAQIPWLHLWNLARFFWQGFLKSVSPYMKNDTGFWNGFSEVCFHIRKLAFWHGFCKTVWYFGQYPLPCPCLSQLLTRLLYIFYIGAGLLQTLVPEGWIRACTAPLPCLSRPDCFVREDLKTQNSSDIKGNNFKFKLKEFLAMK